MPRGGQFLHIWLPARCTINADIYARTHIVHGTLMNIDRPCYMRAIYVHGDRFWHTKKSCRHAAVGLGTATELAPRVPRTFFAGVSVALAVRLPARLPDCLCE